MGPTNELQDNYALSSLKTLEEAMTNIIDFLGMHPCERTEKVPQWKSSHILLLAGNRLEVFLVWNVEQYNPFIHFTGVFRGGFEVLVRAALTLSDGVTMQLTVRSQDPDVSKIITTTMGGVLEN